MGQEDQGIQHLLETARKAFEDNQTGFAVRYLLKAEELAGGDPAACLVIGCLLDEAGDTAAAAVFVRLVLTGVPPKPVRLAMRRALLDRPHLFARFFRTLEGLSGSDADQVAESPSETGMAGKIADDLRREGISAWPGLFAEEDFLRAAKRLIADLGEEQGEAFAAGPPNAYSVSSLRHGYEFVMPPDNEMGRHRCRFSAGRDWTDFPVIDRLMREELFTDIGAAYFGVPVSKDYIDAEWLVPARLGQSWHLDEITDHCKAMVLLTDVEPETGPLIFKSGSHRKPDSIVASTVYDCFDRGHRLGQVPPDEIVDALPHETRLGLGKAGDCLFFDTGAVHRGSTPKRGIRWDLVIAMSAATPLNAGITPLKGANLADQTS